MNGNLSNIQNSSKLWRDEILKPITKNAYDLSKILPRGLSKIDSISRSLQNLAEIVLRKNAFPCLHGFQQTIFLNSIRLPNPPFCWGDFPPSIQDYSTIYTYSTYYMITGCGKIIYFKKCDIEKFFSCNNVNHMFSEHWTIVKWRIEHINYVIYWSHSS